MARWLHRKSLVLHRTSPDPSTKQRRAFLVGVALSGQAGYVVEEHLEELAELASSSDLEVVGNTIQRRKSPDPRTFIGRGKAEEIATASGHLGADLVIFDDDLSPGQVKNLEEIFDKQVIDRSALILEIFVQRARTREARTQVELAQNEYLLPRLTRRWTHLSRQVGGIGVRGGEGETQLEADRRMLRKRIQHLKKDLAKIERSRAVQRRGRRDAHVVALAGYTNAGKSTLFNKLTRAGTQVADRLFATLDSKLRRGPLDHNGSTAVFSDTVGFIRKLPHHLVASFRSTLEEITYADVVLHVVDRSNPRWEEQMEVADEVLAEIGVDRDRVVTVFNKADRVKGAGGDEQPAEADGEARGGRTESNGHPLWVSALTGSGVDLLRSEIRARLG
jgi:GTP-binding protein HflX